MNKKLFLLHKSTYIIYLFSYLIFVLLNNFLEKIYLLAVFEKISPHITYWAEWCRNGTYEHDWVIRQFFIFLFLKLFFVAFIFLFYKLKPTSHKGKLLLEIIIAYLLFDVLYLILTPINYFIPFDLNWYYGSQLYQLLINKLPNYPEYLVSIFWLLILLLILLNTEFKQIKLKYWFARLGGVLVSFIWGIFAMMLWDEILHGLLRR